MLRYATLRLSLEPEMTETRQKIPMYKLPEIAKQILIIKFPWEEFKIYSGQPGRQSEKN